MTRDRPRARILVLGATGTVGQHVVRQLTAQGLAVRAGSRRAGVAADLAEPAAIDLETGAGLAAALDGIDALFLSTPDADWQCDAELRAVAAAGRSGVSRIVKLSAIGADTDAYRLGRMHGRVEDAIRASGMAWTMLRPSAFMQNFATYYQADLVTRGVLRLPCGTAPVSFVDARDIAGVAVPALTREGYAGRSYDLFGPEPLAYAAALALLTEETGLDATFEAVSEADYRAAAGPAASAETIERLLDLYRYYRSGRAAGPGLGLAALGGAPLTTFRAFARDFRTAFQAPHAAAPGPG